MAAIFSTRLPPIETVAMHILICCRACGAPPVAAGDRVHGAVPRLIDCSVVFVNCLVLRLDSSADWP
nr:hypothetical protein [Micromonospora sp. DSM 115978]